MPVVPVGARGRVRRAPAAPAPAHAPIEGHTGQEGQVRGGIHRGRGRRNSHGWGVKRSWYELLN